MYLCFRPLDYLIVRQRKSRPWKELSNQLVIYSEFPLDVAISICEWYRTNSWALRSLCSCITSKIIIVIFSHVIQLLSQVLEDFLKISMVEDLHVAEFQPCPYDLNVTTSLQFPAACWAWRFTTPHQCPGARRQNVILSPLLRICCWVLVVSHQFPGARWT